MIRRTAATLALTAAVAAAGTALAGSALAAPNPPEDKGGGGLNILSGITVHTPINIPVLACLTASISGSPQNTPSDSCLSVPGKTTGRSRSPKAPAPVPAPKPAAKPAKPAKQARPGKPDPRCRAEIVLGDKGDNHC